MEKFFVINSAFASVEVILALEVAIANCDTTTLKGQETAQRLVTLVQNLRAMLNEHERFRLFLAER